MYAGMTLYLTASTVLGAAYSWSGPNGFSSASQNPAIPNAGQTASGDYSVMAFIGTCVSSVAKTTVIVNPPLKLSVQSSSYGLVFNWEFGALESATNILGPWNSVVGATSPHKNEPTRTQEFFRIRLL
jgi:hypothetical protein